MIPLSIKLVKDTENPTDNSTICEDTTMTITVVDLMTGAAIQDALITIQVGENVQVDNIKTDVDGQLHIPSTSNGNYEVTVSKEGYTSSVDTKTIECSMSNNCSCDTGLTVSLDQPRCGAGNTEEVMLPVTVKDNITNHMIEGALVTLVLTNSVSGHSRITVDQPKYTDTTGTTQFSIAMNGDYSLSVTAQGYVQQELPVEVNCNPDHCLLCTPSASVSLKQEFCVDKSMEMIVKNSLTNEPVEGAEVIVSFDTFEGLNELVTITTDDSGEADIPLVANGLYVTEVSMPGYVLSRSSFHVNMTQEECELITPVELTPLSPEPPADCVRLSLTWGENPQDLDLYSYRVNTNETEDQCLTYYCDGKDPCNGTAFEVDNKSGGLNGSETISYCSTEEYTNMVYVDDLSGQGASLLNSHARLVIVGAELTQEIVLDTSDASEENNRYWLAGCLTTTNSGRFEFITLNAFMDVQPNIESPLHCNSIVSASNVHYDPLENASARIVVVNALTDEPLEGVMTTMTGDIGSITGQTRADGSINIPVSQNGRYSILSELDGYVQEAVAIEVDCQGGDCETEVFISMLPTNIENAIQILLNWGDSTEDLDLHVIQVDKNDNRVTCETYYNNMDGCKDTFLNHNIRQGGVNGSETVTIRQITSNQMFSYMVFADDNTVSESSLGTSRAHITVTDGTNSVIEEIPAFTEDTVAGARYWLAGCLQIVGDTFRYVAVNRFSRENPNIAEKLFCDNFFKNELLSDPVEPFCEDTHLHVVIHDSTTNDPVPNVKTSVRVTKDDEEHLVVEAAVPDDNGILSIPIKQNGHYVVKVEGDGYMSLKENLDVNCDISNCRECKPSVLVPLSPLLQPGEVRMTMSWGERPMDLDIYTQQKNLNNPDPSCTTYYSNKNGCDGVSLDLDNYNGGNNGVETITFHDVDSRQGDVYMVFVHHYGSSRVEDEFESSGVHLSLTDGQISSTVNMETDNYNGEQYWLAGCIKMVGSSYQFAPVNIFFNSKPDGEVPNLCLEQFGYRTTTTPRPLAWYNPRRWWG